MGQSQKPDHRANFFMVPRAVVASVAWRHASLRARAILQIMQYRHDGRNNGQIALTLKDIARELGGKNHGANAKAIAELIALGFIECTSGADHRQAKAREFRITFIPTGEGKRSQPATNEYQEWRPAPGNRKVFGGARSADPMKFGAAVTAMPTMKSDTVTATEVKFHVTETATGVAGIAHFSTDSNVAETVTLLSNHLSPQSRPRSVSGISPSQSVESIAAPVDELRAWLRDAITAIGGAKLLAKEAGVPEATLSRFKNGKGLPERYRLPLHEACGRALPYSKWKAAA